MNPESSQITPAVAMDAAWRLSSTAGKCAVGMSLVAVAASLWFLVPMAVDLVRPAPRELEKGGDPQKDADQQKITFDGYVAQIRGRSLFFEPPAPRASEPAEEAKVDENKPPPPPSSYGGPSIVAMLSDVVWFSNGKKMKVGESADGLKVVALLPPWESRLEWKGVEFNVGFFERSKVGKPVKESDDAAGASTKDSAPNTIPDSGSGTDAKKPDDATKAEDASEAKSEDPKASDAKPADSKPEDAKPNDAKPADSKPGDKPPEAKPGDSKPGDPKATARK